MWVINKRNIWIAVALLAVGVVFLVLGFTADPASKADDGTSLRSVYLLMGTIFLGVTVGTFVVFFIYNALRRQRMDNLRASGLRGFATVLSSGATGDTANNIPLVEMDLRVEVEGKQPYDVTHREYINPVSLAAVQPGSRLPVLVDPRKPKKIEIDW